jgi:serine/threonine protein phosphatase PrpC
MTAQITSARTDDSLPYTHQFPVVGDPGAQAEVVPILGPLTVGLPDSIVDFAACGPWQVRGCATRGMSHRYAGTPRQDSFSVAANADWVVAAVCDGVSQGRESHVAAETAARALCKLALDAVTPSAAPSEATGAAESEPTPTDEAGDENIDEAPNSTDETTASGPTHFAEAAAGEHDLDGMPADEWQDHPPLLALVSWEQISQRTSRRIIDEARYRGLATTTDDAEPSEQLRQVRAVMATTAVVVLLSRSAAADGSLPGVLALLAGDSGAYRVSGGVVSPLLGGKGDDGPITSSAVRPLPGVVTPQVLPFRVAAGEAVILVSDGIGDPLGNGSSTLGQLLGQLWQRPPTPGQLLEQVNFLLRSFDDDRTAVGLWNTLPTPGGRSTLSSTCGHDDG